MIVWVFTAECCTDRGRQVIAVTDYDPMPCGSDHMWELLERYVRRVHKVGDRVSLEMYLNQYAESSFWVEQVAVMTAR